jgi:uncharacterized protein (TIGR00255 family)
MIRSMTGYGAAGVESEAVRAAVTARSLNHRFLDVTVHASRRLQSLEAEIKEAVGRTVHRGRVELSVHACLVGGPVEEIVPSRSLVASFVRALRDMQNEFGLEGGVSVSDLVRLPGALERAETMAAIPEETRLSLMDAVGRALEGLDAMRQSEGDRLRVELERVLGAIEAAASGIERRADETREARQATLMERLRGLVGELGLDETRLLHEVARIVERHDVAEEIQRLRSHSAMARELVATDGTPAGKRLDFLAQELMREANTIASKVADVVQARAVIELKAEIERLREQVQNVE